MKYSIRICSSKPGIAYPLGKRNISVDLAELDYLDSDTINALIVMNRRMLDVFGRLSLLSPQPQVMEILKKSGIHNILKVFANEAGLSVPLRNWREGAGAGCSSRSCACSAGIGI